MTSLPGLFLALEGNLSDIANPAFSQWVVASDQKGILGGGVLGEWNRVDSRVVPQGFVMFRPLKSDGILRTGFFVHCQRQHLQQTRQEVFDRSARAKLEALPDLWGL